LIQKLAPEIVEEELAHNEQSFLICLFIESKRNELKTNVPILDEYRKKIELILKIVDVSLLRYDSIFNELAYIVVRLNNPGLYETIWPSDVSWDFKKERKEEYYALLGEVGVDSITYCAKYRNNFRDLSSDFVFEELYAEFDSLNSLLDLLLAFESKFLSEKKKFDVFEKEFKSFQKETQDVLQEIINGYYKYEMRNCGDSSELMANKKYIEPFAEIKRLIETMNAVLSKECQENCECHLQKFRRSSSQFTHKPIVLTPELDKQIGQCSAELEKLLE
jgi:hypothetical protein